MDGSAAATRDIVVIGGSAGAFAPLQSIARCLPAGLEAAIFVVLHHGSGRNRGFLIDLLEKVSQLPVEAAVDGEKIERGRFYVAVPDRHLVIAEDHIHLTRGPKEGLQRPSINMTFRSAARTYRRRVIGVLLSGLLDDGASGMWEISRHQGVTVVQDPEQASYPSMPASAIRDAPIDFQKSAEEIGPLLGRLVAGASVLQPRLRPEESLSERFSGFSCPECHGPLWEREIGPPEFACRVGHIFSLEALLDEHTSMQERKLYEAILSLEEGATLAELALQHTSGAARGALEREAAQARQHAAAIRKLLQERITAALD